MLHLHNKLPTSIVAAALLAASCTGGDTEVEWEAPVANAGEDQQVSLGTTVTLDGSTSTVTEGFELAYIWAFEMIPIESGLDAATFGSVNGTAAGSPVNFLPDVVGTYVVSLTVTDGVAQSNPDIVVVTVQSDNLSPIADCGDDAWGEVEERVHFDGTASRDPEGAQLEYEWTLASKPDESAIDSTDIYDRQTAEPSLVADASGDYVLSLVVSDGIDYSEPCYVSAHISSENQAPIADAGATETLSPCADEIELNGFGSFDPDGDEITYQWEVVEVPAGSTVTDDALSDPTLANPVFTWDVIGTYTFALQVFDGELESARDLVSIVVQDPSDNRGPTANAGDDQTAEATTTCTTQDYVFDCDPCDPILFELDGTMSSDPDGDVRFGAPYLAWTQAFAENIVPDGLEDTNETFEVTLTVADCNRTSTDAITLTATCTGEL